MLATRSITVGLVFLLFGGVSSVDAGYHPPPPCGTGDEFSSEPGICVDETTDGAACLAHGILVFARDPSGSADLPTARSEAATERVPLAMPRNAFQPLVPPQPAQAQASAQEAGFQYRSGALTVSARTVYSECHTTAVGDGQYTEAFGRAGVEDLSITVGSAPPLEIDVLDYRLEVQSDGGHQDAWSRCTLVRIDAVSEPCDGIVAGSTGSGLTIKPYHEWGPRSMPGGDLAFGGAALHLAVNGGGFGGMDIWIGAVQVTGQDIGAWPPIQHL